MLLMLSDAPPSSVLDSKWVQNAKQRNCLESSRHARSSQRQKGQRGVLRLWDQTRKRDKLFSYSVLHPKSTNKLVRTRSAPFGCWDKPRATWTHLTHHGPNSGEATTFPLIVFSTALHGGYIRMALFPGTPKEESRNCPDLDSRDFVHP